MKKELGIKNRIRIAKFKRYFTEKPKQDFWFWAFITSVLFRYVGPLALIFFSIFQVGLLLPEVDSTEVASIMSETLTSIFTNTSMMLFEAGQNIAINNPTIAKILFYGISYFIWVLWIAAAGLILQLLRYFISWLIRKRKEKK